MRPLRLAPGPAWRGPSRSLAALLALAWALALALPRPCPATDPPLKPPITDPPAASTNVDVDATPKAVADDDPATALRKGLDLELQRNWVGAIETYESAVEHWPARAEFRHRLRLCEIHYRLGRRYQDKSFRAHLLGLPTERALELYDELLERIETHYVEPVAFEPLLRRGLDNLEVALRDPVFLRANAPGRDATQVQALRDAYRARRGRVAARDRSAALGLAVAAGEQGRQLLGLSPTAVLLEFAFGACDALDDYSCYLTPDRLDDLFAMIDGNFVGIGVELKQDERGLRVVGVIPGGPAAEAGLKAGDRITHVDGKPIVGLGLDEAAGRLQGAEGTEARIAVLGQDGSERSYRLVRRAVEVRSVTELRMVPGTAVGYVQLGGFQKSSTDELDAAIALLQRQGMLYLVLDLRGNPGGLLNVAVDIADRFLDNGVIVSTRGRAPGQSAIYRARAGAPWRMPMAILIDRDSASASEILAGALKENRRAVVVGERSYGKGSVQSIFTLRAAEAGLKLTTAKFYSPRDRAYSEQGVDPDLAVAPAKDRRRVAAKPPADAPPPAAASSSDPILEAAVALARKQLNR
ncbi:MAG TPA: S41 family peptidase [Isosphaeraceae bacterium]|jgi:carboxyl-terminal processing protease|nr:S41 family peptidase [Isosphaeraceae bacterium]